MKRALNKHESLEVSTDCVQCYSTVQQQRLVTSVWFNRWAKSRKDPQNVKSRLRMSEDYLSLSLEYSLQFLPPSSSSGQAELQPCLWTLTLLFFHSFVSQRCSPSSSSLVGGHRRHRGRCQKSCRFLWFVNLVTHRACSATRVCLLSPSHSYCF